jgi:hypothetical protein
VGGRWPVVLYTHALAESSRAGHWQTLPLALANALVQFRSDLRVLQLCRPLHRLRAIKAGLPLPPVLRCASNPRYVTPASTSARMKGVRRAWLLRARCIRSLPPPCRLSFRLAAPRASHERASSYPSFQFVSLHRACSIDGGAPDWRPPPSRACSHRRRPEDWVPVLHAEQLLLRFLLPNPCSLGLAASLPRSHTRPSAARATCPSVAQRLHSSALRAARSRTRRHVVFHQLPYATARTHLPAPRLDPVAPCALTASARQRPALQRSPAVRAPHSS